MQLIIGKASARLLLLVTMAGLLYGVDLPVVADVHVGASTLQAGTLPNLLVGGGHKALLRFGLNVLPAAEIRVVLAGPVGYWSGGSAWRDRAHRAGRGY